MLTLASISLERYVAVLHPFRHRDLITFRVVTFMIVYPWIQGVIFATVPIITHWIHYDYWEGVCAIDWFYQKAQAIYYVITACVLCFAVPGVIMIYCYVCIMREAHRSQKKIIRIAPQSGTIGKSDVIRKFDQTRKTLRSLLVVVFCFFICMTPFCITKLLKVLYSHDPVSPYVNLLSSYGQYLSSVVNPFIYVIFRVEFRAAYRRLYNKVKCTWSHVDMVHITVSHQSQSIIDYPVLCQRNPQLALQTAINSECDTNYCLHEC